MSDFLDRLATRSLGPKPNLRPRLMPIFDVSPLAPEQPLERPGAVRSNALPPVPAEELVRKVRTQPEETAERRVVSEVHETHVTALDRVSERLTEISSEISSERRVVHETAEIPIKRLIEPRLEPATPIAPQNQASKDSSISAVTQVVQMLPEKPTSPPGFVTRLTPSGAAPLPIENRVEPAPRVPDVEIHINRVEVRAQFAAAPPKREAPKPKGPTVSLDQYLEGRR